MTASSNFHDTDPSGLQTLERFARAGRFNRWLFETIYPYCSGKVLEVGSGIGNLSRFFLEKKFLLTASDLRDEYCNILHEKFGRNPYLEAIQPIDLTLPGFEMHYHSMTGKFNTIVALNVIEHIKDAGLAINNCKKLLMPGGCMVILVPAYPFLYNELDKELGILSGIRPGHYNNYCNRKNWRSFIKNISMQPGFPAGSLTELCSVKG